MKNRVISALCALFVTAPTAQAQVERASFDASPFSLGTLNEAEGGLPRTLWDGAEVSDIRAQLNAVPTVYEDPAKRMILRRVLLSPGDAPRGADEALAGLKLMRAAEAGYVVEAAALAELTPGLPMKPHLSQIVAYRDLLLLRYDKACARGANLREGRQAPFFVRLRAFCYIHAGEVPAAELSISLAREEQALSAQDEAMFRALLSKAPTTSLPQNALQYAGYRKLGSVPTADDVEKVTPPVVVAIAFDRGVTQTARQAALERAALEDLIPPRELGNIAETMPGTSLATDVGFIRALPQSTEERAGAIGEALKNVADNPAGFMIRAKIFGSEIASTAPGPEANDYSVEYSLALLLNNRYEAAEAWMQSVAGDQGSGQRRAFYNLTKLYSFLRPGPAQRLAGAVGEDLPPPPDIAINVFDRAAHGQVQGELAQLVDHSLAAAQSGSIASSLLVALATSSVETEGELARIRDTVAATLYDQAGGHDIAREAAFRSAALGSAATIRQETVNPQFYRPRLKPSRSRR